MSFTSNDSNSYYYDMYFHQQSLYAALVVDVTPNYKISINGDITDSRYRENDGINRREPRPYRQQRLSHRRSAAEQMSYGYGTEVDLSGTTVLNPRTIIDEPAGTGAHSLHGMLQIIQTLSR